MLTRHQFNLLQVLIKGSGETQRKLAECVKASPSSVNRTMKELTALGYAERGTITAAGRAALEPYRVKRAIFLAAGFGSRLVPVTLNTPKPLVRVFGTRIIDTLLDAVLAAGIEEIWIVRGYLSEQFDQLLRKYPNIRFIENENYNEANNISSAFAARNLFANAYIFEADILLKNRDLISPYQYSSNFLGFKVDRTDDWCFTVKDGVITEQKIGGLNCYKEIGISYWDAEDGKKIRSHIEQVYAMPGGKERYWDEVPMRVFRDEYRVKVRECDQGDAIEIDTYRELKELDSAYNV